MSSDMFSSLVEKDVKNSEPAFYKDIEFANWLEYSKRCRAKDNSICMINQFACLMSKCIAWQINEYAKFGRII